MKKLLVSFLLLASSPASAAELVQQFKDPMFNGVGYGSVASSIYQQEQSAKQAIITAQQNAILNAQNAAASTPTAKFIALFTSQVYSQLATQLSNNLFSGSSASNAGMFNLAGNTVSYVKSGTSVTLTVVDLNGNQTVVTVPIATFAF
jgi:hypothetical protein